MLTATIRATGATVVASEVEKQDGPFVCRSCGAEAIVKKGQKVVHHFAHKADTQCSYAGESVAHMAAKRDIFDALCKFGWLECELEKPMGTNRPDVYVKVKATGEEIAIEVQISNLTAEQIADRTTKYNEMGIYVLWLPLWSEVEQQIEQEEECRFAPRHWQKWLRGLNDGQAFYWIKGQTVRPARFENFYLDTGKLSKKFRKLKTSLDVQITENFSTAEIEGFEDDYDQIVIPDAKILTLCEAPFVFMLPDERVRVAAQIEERKAREAAEIERRRKIEEDRKREIEARRAREDAERQRKADEEWEKYRAEQQRIADWVAVAFLLCDWEPAPGEVERLEKEDHALLKALQYEKQRREDDRRRQFAESERQRIATRIEMFRNGVWVPTQAEGVALRSSDPKLFDALMAEVERQRSEMEFQRWLEEEHQRKEKFIARCRALWRKLYSARSKEFVQSMVDKFKIYGCLTDAQQEAIDKMFNQYRIPEAQ